MRFFFCIHFFFPPHAIFTTAVRKTTTLRRRKTWWKYRFGIFYKIILFRYIDVFFVTCGRWNRRVHVRLDTTHYYTYAMQLRSMKKKKNDNNFIYPSDESKLSFIFSSRKLLCWIRFVRVPRRPRYDGYTMSIVQKISRVRRRMHIDMLS